ncbi:MAG: aminoglycoside phosphotransferase family protein [Candidatus Shapirobacteria bacterium]
MSFTIENKTIETILSKNNLDKLTSIEELKSGSINPTFLINNKYILRIDLGNSEYQNKLKKESIIFTLLPKFNIPTPKLFAFDDSKIILEFDYLLMSYISGKNLKDDFQSELSLELGDLVRKINLVTANDLGDQEIFGDIDNWLNKIKLNFKMYWKYLTDLNYFNNDISRQIETIYDDYCKIRNWNNKGRLIHGDINPGNIVANNGNIVGIFDFEYATIADPLGDLERLAIDFQINNNFNPELFLQGYGQNDFSSEELTRIKMYNLSQGLWEIWATKTQQFPYGQKEIDEGTLHVLNTLRL